MGRGAANGAVVGGEPGFVQVGADIVGDGARRGFDLHVRNREIAPEPTHLAAQRAVAIVHELRRAGQGDADGAAMAGAGDGRVGHFVTRSVSRL